MGRLRFASFAWAVPAIALFLSWCACGGKKPAASNPFAAKVSLTPSVSYSMQVGSVLQLSAIAQNSSNATLNTTFTYTSSNPAIVDIAPNGAACAGTWDAPAYAICTPGGIGVAQVTAEALGGTSAPTLFFVHGPIDNIQISIVPPVNSPPPACPAQQALPPACSVTFNTAAANQCVSQNQVQTLQATAFSQGNDVTTTVGPFTWSEVTSSVVEVTPIVTSTAYNVATNQATVSAGTPGQTQVIASASGFYSQPFDVETCLVQCIELDLGIAGSGVTNFSVDKGTSEIITATAVDSQGCIVPKPPLTWTSSAPASISVGSAAACSTTNTCTVSTPQPGSGVVTASCSPPTCNIGFPLNPAGYPAGSLYLPVPVYPVTSISGLVGGATSTTSVLASSQDCSGNVLCDVAISSVSTSTNLPTGTFEVPTPPNSLLFDPPGDKAYEGSEFGAAAINPANFGGTSSAFTLLPASGTPLGLVTGQVLAVSRNGSMAVFSDTISTPNQVYVVTQISSASSVALNISGAIAAAFSPDGVKAFILANGGNSLYIYSTLQPLAGPISLPTPATSVVFSSAGSFAMLSGGGAPGNLAIYNSCDNSAVTGQSSGAITTPPMFLQMVPAANVPLNATLGNVVIPALETAGLDFFFGVDNTGIDIIATNTSLLPLPLPSGPLTLTTLCPRPVVLAQTPTTPATVFAPVHINIGHGTFNPIAFFLSPGDTQAYIVTSDFGVLIYNFETDSVSAVALVNDAAPLAASMTADGALLYVAGSDGMLHAINTELYLDQYQVLFPALPNTSSSFCYTGSACSLNMVAVKP
jgi:hypothetical protein